MYKKSFWNTPWPGNVRELEHTLEHAFILCHGDQDTIIFDHLPLDLKNLGFREQKNDSCRSILQALEKTHWNKTEAARLLGISRQSLYRKMKKYKIQPS